MDAGTDLGPQDRATFGYAASLVRGVRMIEPGRQCDVSIDRWDDQFVHLMILPSPNPPRREKSLHMTRCSGKAHEVLLIFDPMGCVLRGGTSRR